MFENGLGVAQDFGQAVYWYRKAAEQGYADGQANLGYMYRNGYGVTQDTVIALAWSTLGSDESDVARSNRNLFSQQVNDKQRAEAERLAANWRVGTSLPDRSKTWKVAASKPAKPTETSIANTAAVTVPVKKANSRYPVAPAHKPGYITCNTNCMNGDCYRTYSDGRQVHFQAQQKFNPFTSQFEWDSGGC